jgi:hypothetical protein
VKWDLESDEPLLGFAPTRLRNLIRTLQGEGRL